MLGSIVLLLVLIILNALFAASEIAVISVNPNKIEEMANNGHKKAKYVQRFIAKPTRFLSTIQSGITFVGFFASASASHAFADDIGNFLAQISFISESFGRTLAIIIVTVLLSFVNIIFGELVPKRLAMKKPEQIAFFMVGLLRIVAFVLRPFVWLLTISTNLIIRMLGLDPNQEDKQITEEEIRTLVSVGGDKGVIHESEKEMINNIFEFDDTEVAEIMTHRTEVIAIPIDANIDEVVNLVFNEKYTRFPVYENNIDNIIGILHVKDLLRYKEKYVEANFSIKQILRPAYYVPDSKKISDLFKEMQNQKVHMAIVIDEYGGTAGIVTIEDLIEEIVGNIFDEYDEEEIDIQEINENEYIIEGLTGLDDVEELLNIGLPVDDYDTLSGFIISLLGRLPDDNDHDEVKFGNCTFKIMEVDEKVISKVKVVQTPAKTEE